MEGQMGGWGDRAVICFSKLAQGSSKNSKGCRRLSVTLLPAFHKWAYTYMHMLVHMHKLWPIAENPASPFISLHFRSLVTELSIYPGLYHLNDPPVRQLINC